MDFAGVARGQDPGFLDASIGTAPQSTMNPVISRPYTADDRSTARDGNLR